MTNHHADYAREYLGFETFEEEWGFFQYQVLKDRKQLYVKDLYIAPEFRKGAGGERILQVCQDICKANDLTHMFGEITVANGDPTRSLMGHIRMGFKIFGADAGKIWIMRGV